MSRVAGFYTTAEAAEVLSRPRDYNYVRGLATRGKIRKVEWSPRLFLFPIADIEKVKREQDKKLAKAA